MNPARADMVPLFFPSCSLLPCFPTPPVLATATSFFPDPVSLAFTVGFVFPLVPTRRHAPITPSDHAFSFPDHAYAYARPRLRPRDAAMLRQQLSPVLRHPDLIAQHQRTRTRTRT